jgi:predicted Zn-dependent protease with MMP-like domain
MDLRRFERLVWDAYEALPEEILSRLENVDIEVLPRPTREQRRDAGLRGGQTLLGLYLGIPLTQRGHHYNLAAPDRIFIYAEPHVARASDMESLRRGIERTLMHEIAHYFGIEERRLRELDFG